MVLIEIYQKNWEKAALLKSPGPHSPGAVLLSHCAFPLRGVQLPEPGGPLRFRCSLIPFLQGKQKPTNQNFAHVKPQENISKGKSHCIIMLIHRTIAALHKPKPIPIKS